MIFRAWKLLCCGGMCLFFFHKIICMVYIHYDFPSLMRNLLTFEWERDDSAHVDTIMPFFVLSINEFLSDSRSADFLYVCKKPTDF